MARIPQTPRNPQPAPSSHEQQSDHKTTTSADENTPSLSNHESTSVDVKDETLIDQNEQDPKFEKFSNLPVELQEEIWNIHGESPKYTRQQLVTIFTDFYTWMVTYVLPGNNVLKRPPPNGWPGFISGNHPESGKSDFVVDVLRYLPYLVDEDRDDYDIHYSSRVRDYSGYSANDDLDFDEEIINECLDSTSRSHADKQHIIQITVGRGSGGRDMYLDTISGDMIVEKVRFGHETTMDVADYFAGLKEQYLSLKMIKIPGVDTFLITGQSGDYDEVDEETVFGQEDKWIGGEIDLQYVKQVFRQHGWPDAFRKEEAFIVLANFVERREA